MQGPLSTHLGGIRVSPLLTQTRIKSTRVDSLGSPMIRARRWVVVKMLVIKGVW